MVGIKRLFFISLFFLFCFSAFASSSFVISKIRVDGAQRISRGTVLSYVPVHVGDRFERGDSVKVIRALYKTNFFSNVRLFRYGNELVIRVDERPIIGSIHLSGNKKIKTSDLRKILNQVGFIEGRVFDHSVLTELKQALLQEYYNLGRYNARIDASIGYKARKRVAVNIKIYEGPVAKIKSIHIIGNRSFSESKLLKNFSLTTFNLWSWFTGSDQYSRVKLAADIEHLRSFYMDRGYLEFKIDTTQVSITPDKRQVFVVIHVVEGPVYHISGATISGDTLGKRRQLLKLVTLKKGDVFSRAKVIAVTNSITKFFGDDGHAFASITPVPSLDKRNHRVFINFKVRPGRIIYVRRITFSGNTKTNDNVIRREMRQMEDSRYSLSKINESKRRLNNLGYLTNITTKLTPVPGRPNQVDLSYNVKEQSSTTISAQVGYSDVEGFLYGVSLQDTNFLGTGKTVGLAANASALAKTFNLNYYNPYFTQNNISLSTNVYAQHVTPNELNMSDYTSDNYGANMSFGYPITENGRVDFGGGFDYTSLHLSGDAATELKDFVAKHGRHFTQFKLTAGYNYSNLDRLIFPTNGVVNSLSAELGIPIVNRSISYYKVSDELTIYHPLIKNFILDLHAFAGYGNGYGKYKDLPFFKNYFSGGIGSVRGFQVNTLGPKDSTGNALGGNISVNGSAGLVFPNPFPETVRTIAFVDAGNVYQNSLRLSRLRYSAGLQVEWRTPFAPLVFALATPIKRYAGDNTEVFQFSVSTSF